jgi:hypothetical protein
MMMMRTGRIPVNQGVDGAIEEIAMILLMVSVCKTRRAVRY